jgi:hypothetical protein
LNSVLTAQLIEILGQNSFASQYDIRPGEVSFLVGQAFWLTSPQEINLFIWIVNPFIPLPVFHNAVIFSSRLNVNGLTLEKGKSSV